MTLADEIKQKRPFASRRQESAVALLLTADLFRRRVAAAVEPHGVALFVLEAPARDAPAASPGAR